MGPFCQAEDFSGQCVYRHLFLILSISMSSCQLTIITKMQYVPSTIVMVKPGSQQLSTRQPLAHPSPSPPAGWGGEMDKRENSWVDIKTV